MTKIEYIDFLQENKIKELESNLFDEASEISQYDEIHLLIYESFLKNIPQISYGWAHQISYQLEQKGFIIQDAYSAALDYVSLFQSYKSDIDTIINNANSHFIDFANSDGLAGRVFEWFAADYPNIPDTWPSDVSHDLSECGIGFQLSSYTREEVLPYSKECYQIYLKHFPPVKNSGEINEQ